MEERKWTGKMWRGGRVDRKSCGHTVSSEVKTYGVGVLRIKLSEFCEFLLTLIDSSCNILTLRDDRCEFANQRNGFVDYHYFVSKPRTAFVDSLYFVLIY